MEIINLDLIDTISGISSLVKVDKARSVRYHFEQKRLDV